MQGQHLGKAACENGGRGCVAACAVLRPNETNGAEGNDCQQAFDPACRRKRWGERSFRYQLLGGGAGGNQAVETRDCTASDGDEQGGEQEARCGSFIHHGLAR